MARAELGQPDPAEIVADLGQRGIGMSDRAQAIDFASLAAQRLGHDQRKSAPAGQDADATGMARWWSSVHWSLQNAVQMLSNWQICKCLQSAICNLLHATARRPSASSSSADSSAFTASRAGRRRFVQQRIDGPLQLLQLPPHLGQLAEGGLLDLLIAFGRGGNADHAAPSGTSLVTPAIAPSTARSPM